MKLGGPARNVITITKVTSIPAAYEYARTHNLPIQVIGGGSNLLARDEGFDGLIIRNKLKGIKIVRQDAAHAVIRADSGEILDDLVRFTVRRKLSGIELLSAIPGTVGAAPVQNSGAYGQEIGDSLLSVEVYDIEKDTIRTLQRDELMLAYRHSIFNSEAVGKYFIISITIRLNKTPLKPPFYNSLQAYLEDKAITNYTPANLRTAVMSIRADKLPDPNKVASAGSFFKNVVMTAKEAKDFRERFPDAPVYAQNGQHKLATAWLLDQAGLKGKTFHGMTISPQAPLVLINTSAKNFRDLERARDKIIAKIEDQFGITISPEPQIIGS